MSEWLGYDPDRPVTVDAASGPGQHAIVQQVAFNHLRKDGSLAGWSGLCMTVEGPNYMASNNTAAAIAERLNNGMLRTHDETDAEHDDG